MSTGTSRSTKKQTETIPDDWDDEVSEDEEVEPADPKKVWEEAEKQPPAKAMPVIVSKTAGGSAGPFVPPAEAFAKPRQILRRQPTSSSTSGNQDPNNGANGAEGKAISLADRERVYLDARERIFGNSASPSPRPSTPSQTTDRAT